MSDADLLRRAEAKVREVTSALPVWTADDWMPYAARDDSFDRFALMWSPPVARGEQP